MQFSPQQDEALLRVSEWLRDPSEILFYLAGYPGTGKTTLARHFAESVSGPVFYAAYTGKAAYVLKQKGCPNARTIHSLIYNPKDKSRQRLRELEEQRDKYREEHRDPDSGVFGYKLLRDNAYKKICDAIILEEQNMERPMFSLNMESDIIGAALVIIDECSMVDEQMALDLLSFNVKILVLGDPAQLPPVRATGYFTCRDPDYVLTEIHRQARDNPIIELCRLARENGRLSPGQYGSSNVFLKQKLSPEIALSAEQILVGRNVTRNNCNARHRQLLKMPGIFPVKNDRLVCLRNNHDLGLLNGSIWLAESTAELDSEKLRLTAGPEEGGTLVSCEVWKQHFTGDESKIPWYEKKEAEEFDYGYALTVHKAQGSQWNKCLLLDEWSSDHRREWLNTGISRAAESIDIVLMNG